MIKTARNGAIIMIKAVFFDFYQTLVHYQPTQAELEAQALESLGIKTTATAMDRPILTANEFMAQQLAKRSLSKRTREEVAALYIEYQHIVLKEAGIKTEEKIVMKLLGMMQNAQMDLALFEDTLPVLTDLKARGLVTGLISNIEKNMTEAIQKLGIASKLDIVVTSQDAGVAKPQPEIFRYAIQKASIQPVEALYVGDQYRVDVIGANAAGMKGILLDRVGYYKQKPDCPVITGLKEVIEYIV
jgi:2-haloalkanoic acid dehalogenase type II